MKIFLFARRVKIVQINNKIKIKSHILINIIDCNNTNKDDNNKNNRKKNTHTRAPSSLLKMQRCLKA